MPHPSSSPSFLGFSVLPISIFFSFMIGGLLVFFFFANYFRRRRSEVVSIAKPEPFDQKPSKNPQPNPKKSHPRSHSQTTDKDQTKRHHPLDVNTLKGHGDSVTALCFSSDGRNLATACADGVLRVFKLDDISSKSFKFLRINLPAAGSHPTAIAFSEGASSLVVAAQNLTGASLYKYEESTEKATSETKHQPKLPLPEIKWEHHKVHETRAIITLVGTSATYGSADGSAIIVSCSEGTDIILWHGKSGKILGTVDTNQLKNNMATISPNGRFLAAAAFTADVKKIYLSLGLLDLVSKQHVLKDMMSQPCPTQHDIIRFGPRARTRTSLEIWEIVYSKDGSVKETSKVMQLKGHKSAVTWLCFTPNSDQIITASKDGSIRIWNINVRYHLDEDPKTLKVFPIPLHDVNGNVLHYERLSLSPDGKILATTHNTTLQWLCAETGNVLDTAEKAHDGDITGITWAPRTIPMGGKLATVLATASVDKKVKLWVAPNLHPS